MIESLELRRLMSAALKVGALGDSYTDEYQFYAPNRSTARNYIEQLAGDRQIDFGAFTATPRALPRNGGFANNWALSGDTSADMIADGQVSGLAAQISAGKVRTALVFIAATTSATSSARLIPSPRLEASSPMPSRTFPAPSIRCWRRRRTRGWWSPRSRK